MRPFSTVCRAGVGDRYCERVQFLQCGEDYTAVRERAAGTTVSILTVFSFYGAEDYLYEIAAALISNLLYIG